MYNCHLNLNNNLNSLHDFIHFYNRPNANLSTHHSSLCSICLKSFTRRSDNCYFERSGLSVQSSATFRVHPTKRCGKYFIHSIHLFNYFYASSANRHVHSPTSLRVKLSSHLIRPYCDILKPSNKFVYFLHSWYSKSSSYFVCSSASHNDKQSTCTCQMHVKSRNYH